MDSIEQIKNKIKEHEEQIKILNKELLALVEKPVYKKRKFFRIKNKIKPLDLICFRGDDFVSESISKMQEKMLGNGDWTHVGIVITTDIIPIKNGVPGQLYVWESTMSGIDGVNSTESGRAKFGVQIRDLEKVLKAYVKNDTTKMAWCKLKKNPLDGENSKQVKYDLEEFHKKHGNDNYDYTVLPLLKTIFPCLGKYFKTKNNFFCSELVATIYSKTGILPADLDPEKIAPVELLGYSNDGIKDIVNDPIILY
jgi:hypothetical protein